MKASIKSLICCLYCSLVVQTMVFVLLFRLERTLSEGPNNGSGQFLIDSGQNQTGVPISFLFICFEQFRLRYIAFFISRDLTDSTHLCPETDDILVRGSMRSTCVRVRNRVFIRPILPCNWFGWLAGDRTCGTRYVQAIRSTCKRAESAISRL